MSVLKREFFMNNSLKIILLSLFLCSLSSRAMEDKHDFHTPTLAKELRAIAELHANKNNIIGDSVGEWA